MWVHYSHKPLKFPLRAVNFDKNGIKPQGLYFAKDESWIVNCNRMGCGNISDDIAYELKNESGLNLYKLDVAKLDNYLGKKPDAWIDWKKIYPFFDGIHITASAINHAKKHYLNKWDRCAGCVIAFDIETIVVMNTHKLIMKQIT